MPTTNYRLGEKSVLYYATAAVSAVMTAAPTGVAANAKDVKISAKTDQPEYTTRANNGIKQYASSLKDLGVTFSIKVPGQGQTDAAYTAFRDAWVNGTEIAVAALTDSIANGGEGPAGNFTVGDFSIDQSNSKVLMADVELKPSSFNNWLELTAST